MKRLFNAVNKVTELTAPIFSKELNKSIQASSKQLLDTIENTRHIKVPIIGDSNAGKTSLLNVLLGEGDKLPESTKPETAIPCEIYPVKNGEEPHIETYREDKDIFNGPISDYPSVRVLPGDYSILYTDSPRIKEWYDKGVILVDMPGSNSGIKEHNDAIMRYITKDRTIFAYFIDAKAGSMSRSGQKFIDEIKNYGLGIKFFITRIDLITPQDRTKVQKYIANSFTGHNVGCISSIDNNISDFETFIDGINANSVCYKKVLPLVKGFIEEQIELLKGMKRTLAEATNQELEDKINAIQSQIDNLKNDINQSLNSADTPDKSTNDILSNVRNKINSQAGEIADVLISSEDGTRLNNVKEMLVSIIRPAIVNGFKEEQEEFIDTLKTNIDSVTGRLIGTIQLPISIIDELISKNKDIIINGIMYIADRLMQSENGFVKIIGLTISCLAVEIPNIVQNIIRGNQKDRLKNELQERICGEFSLRICDSLRRPIREQVKNMQQIILTEMKKQYEQRLNQYNAALTELKKQRDNNNNANAVMCEEYKAVIAKLEQLNQSLI